MADEENSHALASITAHNEVTIVADPDHLDENISAAVQAQWPQMQKNGVKHLFLEHDAREVSIGALRGKDSEYSRMIDTAATLGVQIHLYDDRTEERALDTKYPEQARERLESDPYLLDTDALIATAKNPQRMKAYLDETYATMDERVAARNTRMVENIQGVMSRHPGERALVMLGSSHMQTPYDVDEGLRAAGLQTTTVEINSPNTDGANLVNRMFTKDKADFVVSAEDGKLVSFKEPGSNRLRSTAGMESLPWKNQEPVCAGGMTAALDQAAQSNVSPVQGGCIDVPIAEGGHLAAPTCGQPTRSLSPSPSR